MKQKKSLYAVILAAGQGSRLQESCGVKKQFLEYKNAPLWWNSVKTFNTIPCIKGIVLVFPSDEKEFEHACSVAENLKESHTVPFFFAYGGERRQDSVLRGLKALPEECTHVFVHDSARPFFSAKLVTELSEAAFHHNVSAAIPVLDVVDTIKEMEENNSFVKRSLRRENLRAVQTPQFLDKKLLIDAHEKALAENFTATDDAMLMENAGNSVVTVLGESQNIKITYAKDLDLLQAPKIPMPCSGYGYDVHQFGGNRPFKLGGIEIPTPLQIKAHSDGDVLLHALIDALLGCMCLGDIGKLFPDTDAKFDNISSALLLDQVMTLWNERDLILSHVDLTIICQKPKISPFTKKIAANIARALNIGEDQINIKATTEEGLGFTGQGLGIKAVALVSAVKFRG